MKIPLITENRKYNRNSDKKQTENTKGLTEGPKLPERPRKISKKLSIQF